MSLRITIVKVVVLLYFCHYNIKMFKVIVIGNSSVGKTSIVNRFVGDRFDPNYKATISADFQTKILEIRGNEIRL